MFALNRRLSVLHPDTAFMRGGATVEGSKKHRRRWLSTIENLSHVLQEYEQTASTALSPVNVFKEYVSLCKRAGAQQALPPTLSLSVMRIALKHSDACGYKNDGNDSANFAGKSGYRIARHIYAHMLSNGKGSDGAGPSSYLSLLSTKDWESLAMAADKAGDLDAIKAFLCDIKRLPSVSSRAGRLPTAEILNHHLSCSLTNLQRDLDHATRSSRMAASLRDAVGVFKSFGRSLDSQSGKMIVSHLIFVSDYDTLIRMFPVLLDGDLGTRRHGSYHPIFTPTIVDYLFYSLVQEAKMNELAFLFFNFLARWENGRLLSGRAAPHEILLDAFLDHRDFEKSATVFAQYVGCPRSPSLEDRRILAEYAQKVVSAGIVSRKFSQVIPILVLMRRHHIPISPVLYYKIFDTIVVHGDVSSGRLSPSPGSSFHTGFGALGVWIKTMLGTEGAHFHLDPDMRAAVLKLASRHIVPESFMLLLETLERRS